MRGNKTAAWLTYFLSTWGLFSIVRRGERIERAPHFSRKGYAMKHGKQWMGFAVMCGLMLAVLAGSAVRATAQEREIQLKTLLTPTLAGGAASGQAEFRARGTASQLRVKVQDLNPILPSVQVVIDNQVVGSISLAAGRGENTFAGVSAHAGSSVSVNDGAATLLIGTF
jgi:hypothetical protein